VFAAAEYCGGTPHSEAALERLRPWIELAKPGVTRLVLITTLFGGLVAPGHASLARWLITLLGTVLVVAAANALNMAREADIDALMTRTRVRPLPEGRLEVAPVIKVAIAWALIGTAALLAVNVATAALALLALVSYVWVYTPLKRVTPHALYVGTLPGAIPPLIGYASVTGGQLDARAGSVCAAGRVAGAALSGDRDLPARGVRARGSAGVHRVSPASDGPPLDAGLERGAVRGELAADRAGHGRHAVRSAGGGLRLGVPGGHAVRLAVERR
jgi:hypothetical protein